MRLKTVLLIEDEKPNADRLKRLLHHVCPNVDIVATEESIAASVTWLKNNVQPDLILMDIRLSDGLCFEIFNLVEVTAPIIFTTAYDEYTLKAFKYNSIDYLLKPIKQDELTAALQRYEDMFPHAALTQRTLENLAELLSPKGYRKRFLLPFRDGYKTLLTSDIHYFYSEWGNTKAFLKNNQVELISQTLEELEKQLNPQEFYRANRQYLIHIDAVKSIFNHFNGKLKVELKGQSEAEVLISREKSTAFKSWMDY